MSLQTYNKVKVVGKGSYGEVWLVKHKKDKKQYVLKKLELQNASKRERKAAEQEAKLLSRLKHPNIVSYKDSFQDERGFLFIAMGFCEGGDLYGRLKEQKGRPLEERQVVEWFVQIAMALQYMHERNILHRDLKTQNIFLTKSKIIKVGDLGIARVLDSSCDMATTLIGTPYYMSPELFSNKPYNHKSDVWALGCCVYEMATLKHAFNAKDMNSLVYKILRGKMPQMPKIYSAALVQLIKAMLNQNPERRPSVNRILRDPYIKKNISQFLEGTKKSRSRPGSAGVRSSGSDSSRRSFDVLDSARSAAPPAKGKQRVAQAPDLEPLQVGPDLEPIAEEDDKTEARKKSRNESSKHKVASSKSRSRSNSRSPVPQRKHSKGGLEPSAPHRKGHVRSESDPVYQPHKAHSPKVSRRRITSDSPAPSEVHTDSQEKLHVSDKQQSSSSATRPRLLKKKKKPMGSSADPEPIVISVGDVDLATSGGKLASHHSDILSEFGVVLDSNSKPVLKKVTSEPVLSSGRRNSDQDNYRRRPSQDDKYKLSAAERPSPSTSAEDPRPSSSRLGAAERESGYASASSYAASKDDTETPRPTTARARRREKKELETPRTSRSVDLEKNRKSVDFVGQKGNYQSEDYSSQYRQKQPDILVLEDTEGFDPIHEHKELERVKETEKGVSHSVSSSSGDDDEKLIEKQKKRNEEKEMSNFISLLDTTLKMAPDRDEADNCGEDAVPYPGINGATYVKGPAPKNRENSNIPVIAVEDTLTEDDSPTEVPSRNAEFSYPTGTGALHVPAGRTMTTTGRLWERITVLRKDCIRGLGVEKLKKAYDVLDNIENDEVEPKLIQVLGQEKFDEYAGKIWQLKFCEEAAFGIV